MLHPVATLAGLNFYLSFSCIDILLFLSLILLQVSGNCVSDALDRFKTSPLFFNSAQGGAGELRLQRRPEPPPAVLLQRWSGGSGWGGRDQQIRSAQPEAPRPTRHRHPAQTEGMHLRLWVSLTQQQRSLFAIISAWNVFHSLPGTRYVLHEKNPLPPFLFSWHLLTADDLHPSSVHFLTYIRILSIPSSRSSLSLSVLFCLCEVNVPNMLIIQSLDLPRTFSYWPGSPDYSDFYNIWRRTK